MARFASFTDYDINNLIINNDSQNTKKQIEKQYNVFMAYCKEKALTFVPETVSKLQLNNILGKFYAEARRADGKIYKKTSLFTLKFAIQRKMKAIRGHDFDVINNNEFDRANENSKHSVFS